MTRVKEVVSQFPIRNTIWTFCHVTDRFVTEASQWDHANRIDPWNRFFPNQNPKENRRNFDPENEIESWMYQTTVDSVLVECVVFNT